LGWGSRSASILITYAKRGNVEALSAVNETAEQRGLKTGLALAEARAMHPDLIAVPEDAAGDAHLLSAIADWCGLYTPLVALEPPDGLLLDIGGCAHLFGGEAALLNDVTTRLTRFGFAVHAAIADTIGAAWAASHFSSAHNIASGDERALLAPLPLAALRLPADTIAVLRRVGLKRIGDIIDLLRAPLTARFGAQVLQQLDRALGREREPLTPRLPVPPYFTEQRFAEPIAIEEDILAITHRLAGRLRKMLEARGEGACRIELSLFRTDGAVFRLAVGTSRPTRSADAIRNLFVERLAALADPLDPGFGFDLVRLAVLASAPIANEQIAFQQNGNDADLAHLIDRLSTRFGASRVVQLTAQDSHLPELASVAVSFQRADKDVAAGWDSFRHHREQVELAPRPLRLLAKPEPIEAVAPLPDGPPLRFRWRRAVHTVAKADGPERIENSWWNEKPNIRAMDDYFAVEDSDGRRFWMFRRTINAEDENEDDRPSMHWFMHGLFA
jgi:protein ImuB